MEQAWFVKGMLIALVFGVPAGAIGALTLQRTLREGFRAGFITGLGSTAADMMYACVGAFGVTLVSGFLEAHRQWIGTLSGIMIFAFGLFALLRKETDALSTVPADNRLWKAFLTSFMLALVNPGTVAAFITAFVSFGITGVPDLFSGIRLVLGIGMGTAIWWLALSGGAAWLKTRMKPLWLQLLSRAMGVAMICFGAFSAIRVWI